MHTMYKYNIHVHVNHFTKHNASLTDLFVDGVVILAYY